jgi:hypothetical protein
MVIPKIGNVVPLAGKLSGDVGRPSDHKLKPDPQWLKPEKKMIPLLGILGRDRTNLAASVNFEVTAGKSKPHMIGKSSSFLANPSEPHLHKWSR